MLRAPDVHARHALSDAAHDLVADRAQPIRPIGRRDAIHAARALLFTDQNDLLAEKNLDTEVIQCKRWSQSKVIHEKHIFQLFGTMVATRIENPMRIVTGTFTTTTSLSERAREFAEQLEIKVEENFPLSDYPRIKCNIARRGGADTLMISRYAANPSFEGQRLSVLAAKAGVAPEEYALQLLEKGDASLVSFNMSEGDIEAVMKQQWTMTCTDGDLVRMGEGVPHPRAYGAFARKLKKYVAERRTIDIADAVRSMTTLPAAVFGLKDRGQLRAGAFADILIFDLSKVNDAATYEKPHQLSEGIDDIIVNGELARRNGRFTSALAGRVLRPERR